MSEETTTPTPGATSLAVNTAIAIAPIVLGALNPLAGAIGNIVVKEWHAWRESRGKSPEWEPSAEDIAEFRADIAANSAAANHARARAAAAGSHGAEPNDSGHPA